MKNKISHLLMILLLAFSFKGMSQNYIVFTPLSKEVTVNSGEEIVVTVRANCYGNQSGASFVFINPYIIPDSGYKSYTYTENNGSSILFPGNLVNINFKFKKTVTSTTSTIYKFRADYVDNSNNNHNNFINIKVNYIFNDSDDDGVPDSQDNCPNQAGSSSNNGCPVATCNLVAPTNRVANTITSNSVKLNWNSVTNANNYQSQYKKSTYSSFLNSNQSSSLNRNLYNLEPNTTYHWRVRAKCSNGAYGNWSTIESFTTLKECKQNTIIYDTVNSGETDVIEVSNSITSYAIIKSGANIEYSAGNQIIFPAATGYGFKAEKGSTFRAYIEGCTTTSNKASTKSKTLADTIEGVVIEKSGIEEELIKIYPNPTSNILNISSSEIVTNYTVLNHFNKHILNKNVNNNNFQVNVHNLSAGIYFIRLQLKNGNTITKKIVKN